MSLKSIKVFLIVCIMVITSSTIIYGMPTASITDNNEIGASLILLNSEMSSVVYAQTNVRENMTAGIGFAIAPGISSEGASVLGGYVNYALYQGDGTMPDVSVVGGLGYISGIPTIKYAPTVALMVSKDINELISANVYLASTFSTSDGAVLGIGGNVRYKILEEIYLTAGVLRTPILTDNSFSGISLGIASVF